ncbi:MAG: hypothetical protein R3228_15865 [Halioglobus sp.]|nr:hypothetical protein [Halioglobus sp.]
MDGDKRNVKRGSEFFANHPSTRYLGPKFLHHWIDRETVNEVLRESGFSGEIDLLVVDLDGVDYWIWDAITEISPRVVCVEVMAQLGERSITVPYASDFRAQWIPLEKKGGIAGDGGREGSVFNLAFYGGASLPAYVKLAKQKGYRLIGANRLGINAFFLRDDLGADHFPEVSWKDCVNENYDAEERRRIHEVLEDYAWVEI